MVETRWPLNPLRRERHKPAAGNGDAGVELGLFALRDGNVEIEKRAEALQCGARASGEFEAKDLATLGRVGGRMHSAGAPLDEEGEKASLIVVKIESLPLQKEAIGTMARALGSSPWGAARALCTFTNRLTSVGAGVREQHFSRFDGQQPHRRGRGTKLYRSFYMR
jgi:hypothetical protein